MKKLEEKYIELLNETLKDKNNTIDELFRINRDLIQETRNLIYEFRKYVQNNDNKKKG